MFFGPGGGGDADAFRFYAPSKRDRIPAKIDTPWRFSDLISYFCNWFRASADGAGHIYERFVTFSFTLKLRKFEQQKEM